MLPSLVSSTSVNAWLTIPIPRTKPKSLDCVNAILETKTFEEKLPNGKKYIAVYSKNNSFLIFFQL